MDKIWGKGRFASVLSRILVLVFALSVFAGCAQQAEEPKADGKEAVRTDEAKKDEAEKEDGKKMVIGYATKSATTPFWLACNEGAKKAAEDMGVELVMLGPPKENDVAGQLAVIEDMINKKVSGLAIAPCDSAGVAPAVEKAQKSNIPVIALDTPIDGAQVSSFVATDNMKAAAAAAEWMGSKLNGKGTVVLINGMIQQGSGKERREGFINVLKEKYKDIKIVEVTGDWDDNKALKGMEDAIQANPQIDGVFVGWDGAALAAHKALTAAKRKDKTIICGFDCYPDALKLMKAGTFEADVAQYPYKIGYEGIKAAVMAAKGETVEERIDTGVMLVLPENVDQYIKDNNIKLP